MPVLACKASRIARFVLAIFFALIFSSCARNELSPAEVESINRELIAAARSATNAKAGIRLYASPQSNSGADTANNSAKLPYSLSAPVRILITLRDARDTEAIERSWQTVARAHGLELLRNTTNPRLARFMCRFQGRPTHSMEILLPASVPASGQWNDRTDAAEPRLAVVIDDMGYELPAAERLLALPYPITLAVLPFEQHSSEVASLARARGVEVLLHLPMEAGRGEGPAEPVELRVGMNATQTESTLDNMLAAVPGAAGINNHQGSRATADAALMRELVAALAARHLFLIDSRTTAASVAFDTARTAGLPAVSRTEFLDDEQDPAAIARQLDRAERRARQQGWALAIGHPYRVTLDVLTEALPQLEARGILLVYASDVLE